MNIRVLETNIVHASDVVYWLDGSTGTAAGESTMARVTHELRVTFSSRPRNVHVLSKAGQLAVWRRPDTEAGMIAGVPEEADTERPASPPSFRLAGTVEDPRGLYNPRIFDLTLGDGAGHALLLYPSPKGVQVPQAGALLGNLRLADDAEPLPWAMVQLAVTVSGETLTFRAQADANGDFVLSLRRLPPLPESVDSYDASFSITADPAAPRQAPIDPATANAAMEIASADADEFHPSLALSITPGEVRLLRSLDKNHLAVQPHQS